MLKLALCLFFIPFQVYAINHIVAGCRVISYSGEIVASFPGRNCHFLPDGSFISLSEKVLRFFDHKNAIVWERKMSSPQSRMIVSQRRIHLTLYYPEKNQTEFLVLDFNGTVLNTRTTVAGRANSFNSLVKASEIPQAAEYFYSGDEREIFFLDSDLRVIVGKTLTNEGLRLIKVGQKEDGGFFHLSRSLKSEKLNPVPVVVLFDARNTELFPRRSSPGFFFPRGGDVSYSKGEYAISHPMSGTYLISEKTGELLKYLPITHFDENQVRIPDQIEIADLDSFFSRWNF